MNISIPYITLSRLDSFQSSVFECYLDYYKQFFLLLFLIKNIFCLLSSAKMVLINFRCQFTHPAACSGSTEKPSTATCNVYAFWIDEWRFCELLLKLLEKLTQHEARCQTSTHQQHLKTERFRTIPTAQTVQWLRTYGENFLTHRVKFVSRVKTLYVISIIDDG